MVVSTHLKNISQNGNLPQINFQLELEFLCKGGTLRIHGIGIFTYTFVLNVWLSYVIHVGQYTNSMDFRIFVSCLTNTWVVFVVLLGKDSAPPSCSKGSVVRFRFS